MWVLPSEAAVKSSNTGTLNLYNKYILIYSVALVKFSNRPEDTILIVGIAKDLVLNPRSVTGGELLTYQVQVVYIQKLSI